MDAKHKYIQDLIYQHETFINETFSEKEQRLICETRVTAEKNPEFNTSGGRDTKDRVFLLSIAEAEKYFSSDDDRMCVPTKYAIENGADTIGSYKKDGEATCFWWLRSPEAYSGSRWLE